MSSYNDLLMQSEKAKFNAQQASLSGDKRLQDFYNSTAEQLFLQAMNTKMKADEKEAEIKNYYVMQEQRRQMQNNSYGQSYTQYNESKMSIILETVGIICVILISCLIVF